MIGSRNSDRSAACYANKQMFSGRDCSGLCAKGNACMKREMTILQSRGCLPLKASTLKELLDPDCDFRNVDPEWSFSDIVPTKCRKVSSGSLFIPMHESDDECIEKIHQGALAVLRNHDLKTVPTIVVPDVREAMAKICRWMFEAIELPSIVVTGSTGKTTTKRMIHHVLKARQQVFSELENNNTFFALCLSLQLIQSGSEVIVQEVDEAWLSNIHNCFNILKPRIAVVTNIAESHMAHLGSKENLIRNVEKAASEMPEDGIVIINGDDPDSLRADFGRRTLRVGILDQTCECVAKNIRAWNGGTDFDLCYDGDRIRVRLKVLGEHNVYDAMMAYLVGKLSGLKDRDILRGLARFRNMGIRQNIVRLFGVTVYADCYNASLHSITYALKCFCGMKLGKGKRVAVLGDIAEIEGFEEENYRKIAALLDASSLDAVITFGKDIKSIGEYMNGDLVWFHANHRKDLVQILNEHKKDFRAFLFKASRKMYFETFIQELFPFHYRIMRFQERVALQCEKRGISFLHAAVLVVLSNIKRLFQHKAKT